MWAEPHPPDQTASRGWLFLVSAGPQPVGGSHHSRFGRRLAERGPRGRLAPPVELLHDVGGTFRRRGGGRFLVSEGRPAQSATRTGGF